MKKTCSLFLALVMGLSLLAGCQASDAEPTADTSQESSATVPINPNPEVTTPGDPEPAKSEAVWGLGKLPERPPTPEQIREDLSVETVLAEYRNGTWNGTYRLWSEDGQTSVSVNSEGCLEYQCGPYVFYQSDIPNNLFGDAIDGSRPEDWKNDKVYVDLPGHVRPEGVWETAHTFYEGTYALGPDGVKLYRDEQEQAAWTIEMNLDDRPASFPVFLAVPGISPMKGPEGEATPHVLAGDKIFRLNKDGTTTVELENVVAAVYWGGAPFIRALTLSEDGALTQWSYGQDLMFDWSDLAITDGGVTEADFGCGATTFRMTNGLAYVALTMWANSETQEVRAICIGPIDLNEADKLWGQYLKENDPPVRFDESWRVFARDYCGYKG